MILFKAKEKQKKRQRLLHKKIVERQIRLKQNISVQQVKINQQLKNSSTSTHLDLTKTRKKHRHRLVKILFVVGVIAVLLQNCECDVPAPPLPVILAQNTQKQKVIHLKKIPKKIFAGKMQTHKRGQYKGTSTPPKRWLTSFRMQVAARSPRLAKCFTGVSQPGAIKWVAMLEPLSGIVGEQEFTTLLDNSELSMPQIKCLQKVLSSPNYRLIHSEGDKIGVLKTPSRVGIVIEF